MNIKSFVWSPFACSQCFNRVYGYRVNRTFTRVPFWHISIWPGEGWVVCGVSGCACMSKLASLWVVPYVHSNATTLSENMSHRDMAMTATWLTRRFVNCLLVLHAALRRPHPVGAERPFPSSSALTCRQGPTRWIMIPNMSLSLSKIF